VGGRTDNHSNVVRSWRCHLHWTLRVRVGAYCGQKELCCAGGFASPCLCAPCARGEAAESHPSKSACRNQTGSQGGHGTFARRPYGKHPHRHLIAVLAKYQLAKYSYFSETSTHKTVLALPNKGPPYTQSHQTP